MKDLDPERYGEKRLELAENVCRYVEISIDTDADPEFPGQEFEDWSRSVTPTPRPNSGVVQRDPIPRNVPAPLRQRLEAAEDVCGCWDLSIWADAKDMHGDSIAIGHALDKWKAIIDPFPSERFRQALEWAMELHSNQRRKGSSTPYIAHLYEVVGLVMQEGGLETEAIGALLHDAAEDQDVTLQEIVGRFGPRVASIVGFCTDSFGGGRGRKNSFARKVKYVNHFKRTSIPSGGEVLVSIADKVCNARSLVRDVTSYTSNADGLGAARAREVWDRFNVSKEEQVWFYDRMVKALSGTTIPRHRCRTHQSPTRQQRVSGRRKTIVNSALVTSC